MVRFNDKQTFNIWNNLVDTLAKAMLTSKTLAPKTETSSTISDQIDKGYRGEKAVVDYEGARYNKSNMDALAEIGNNFHFFVLLNKYEKMYQEFVDELNGVKPDDRVDKKGKTL